MRVEWKKWGVQQCRLLLVLLPVTLAALVWQGTAAAVGMAQGQRVCCGGFLAHEEHPLRYLHSGVQVLPTFFAEGTSSISSSSLPCAACTVQGNGVHIMSGEPLFPCGCIAYCLVLTGSSVPPCLQALGCLQASAAVACA